MHRESEKDIRKRKSASKGFVLLAVMLGPLVAFTGCDSGRDAAASAKEEKPINVAVEEVGPVRMVQRVLLPGSVEASRTVDVAAEVAGRVDWIGPAEGSRLKEGRPILRINTDLLQAEYDRAASALELAESNYRRAVELFGSAILPKADFDRIENELKSARANLRLAEVQLGNGTVRSPIDGILDECFPELGEYVKKGERVARVLQLDDVKIMVDLPERFVGVVEPGIEVKAYFPFLREEPFKARVAYVRKEADLLTRTYQTQLILPNRERLLKPGMIAKVEFIVREIPEAIAAPLFSVIPRKGRYYVFIEESSVAHLREVTLGLIEKERAQITSGLSAGEHLITKGQRLLRDGQPVRVITEEEPL